ncbi:phospholipase A [Massilia sp. 9I]|uniref:phospholipase A n=1 Tax=Massilia sp. 9I TaxID=2653152 RepID=UPI0012F00A9D|nr:phospholipase A [Massilia sp. 9I]VXC65670.1 Phospholipase A1 precursor; Outer membrane phospholipase A [Massilia sp. 9I]
MHLKKIPAALLPLLFALPATAQQTPPSIQQQLGDCSKLVETNARLACFDRLAVAHGATPAAPALEAAPAPAVASMTPGQQPTAFPVKPQPDPAASVDPVVEAAAEYTMAGHWELDDKHRRGTFVFRPHNPNYLIAARTYRPNEAPYEPFRAADFTGKLSHAELQYQLGFKMKLVETAFESPVDVWFGYTQNSFWQAGNREASSPFRETNYQPEVMVVTPLNFGVFGANLKYLNLGLNHQSNGQSSTLSRSWNRLYAEVGLERGRLSLTGRVWKRIKESAEDDNNPDITDYMGRAELAGTYRVDGHEFSALLRRNFSTRKGATQLGWAFPLAGPLKGYLHWFSGYGQSLIDYNYFQRTIGAGVVVQY